MAGVEELQPHDIGAALGEVVCGTRRVVDVRSEGDYLQDHVAGSVCIPAGELASRMYELPDTSVPLLLVHGEDQDAEAQGLVAVLTKARWSVVQSVFPPQSLDRASGPNTNRLYKPSPALVCFLDEVEAGIGEKVAFDVGCGHGRDMAHLAARGWEVTGVDNRSVVCRASL